jgi:hypothetical protein
MPPVFIVYAESLATGLFEAEGDWLQEKLSTMMKKKRDDFIFRQYYRVKDGSKVRSRFRSVIQ